MGCMEFTWSTGTGSIETFSYTIIIVIYCGVFVGFILRRAVIKVY